VSTSAVKAALANAPCNVALGQEADEALRRNAPIVDVQSGTHASELN
jgi:hypothetical protein